MKKISTVILAAGKSSRFKHSKSKIFNELAGLPIIEHVYNVAFKVSKNDIIFVCNKDNYNDLKNKFINAKFVIQKKQNGTADAVTCAKKHLKSNNVLILFGDVPLLSSKSINKLINSFYKNKSTGSIIAFENDNPYGYGRIKIKGTYATSIVEEINATPIERKITLCNSGVMICNFKLLFSNLYKIKNKNVKKEKYLPDLISILGKQKKNFTYVLCPKNEMLGVNSIEDLIVVEKIFQNHLKEKMIKNGVIIQQPETVTVSYDSKVMKGCTIEPFVFLKSNVSIKNDVVIKSNSVLEGCLIDVKSSIGPSARIRPKTSIGKMVKIGNFVEVKNSQIGDRTSISHLSYIGDAKIAKDINIGAGTITCNFNGKKKNKTIIEKGVFIGSNCSLIAPLTIGANSTIGAGSVITENIPPNHLALERSKIKILRKQRKNKY